MDRFVRALIQWQAGSRPEPARTLPVAHLRERYATQVGRLRGKSAQDPDIETKDHLIDGGDGTFRVRTYQPPADRGRLVTYLHGGGWVTGSVDTHDPVCRRIACELGAVVVSVDYRRPPEHPHPGPLRDGIAASEWADRAFPGRPHVIAGDSAGGALAMGIAMHHRDHGGIGFAGQLMVYPPADPELRSESARKYGTGYLEEVDDLRWYYDQYVPDPAHRSDPAIDLLSADHRGLPPTVIGTAEFDPLHDEGVELALRLAAQGVEVHHVPAPGLVHGYLLMADIIPAATEAVRNVLAAVEQMLTPVPTAR
ncbi:alpha/beta hydrolase [Streptomyces rubradiris]|nr:alpha/beta hydrolase [Streptomyces rubradiris]